MGEITEGEQLVLVKFKENLSDLDLLNNNFLSDIQLIRWLRARDLDVKRAEHMLRNTLAWREKNDIKNCLNQTIPESVRAEFPVETVGYDREGNLLVYIPFGKMDMKKGLREVGKEGSDNMRNYYLETIFGAMLNKNPKNKMQRASLIIDFKGLTYMQFANFEVFEYLMTSIKIFEQHYPELLNTGFAINTPTVWNMLWTMVKPMLHQKTQDKVVITGSDPQVITEILEKYISKDQFPEKYGGYVKLQYPEPVTVNKDANQNDDSGTTLSPPNKSLFKSIIGNFKS